MLRQLTALLKTMRPRQWTKSAAIFAALLFDRKALAPRYLLATLAGFALLSLVSSVVYIINDLSDIEKDRQHPDKQTRPLPSGQLSRGLALAAAIVLALLIIPASYLLNLTFGIIVTAYLVLQLAYTFKLKNVVLIDVMLGISAGFVLRVAAGVTLVDVERFSPWLYVCTTLLTLFMGFGKRRSELVTLGENSAAHRPVLREYTLPMLDQLITVVTTATIIAYALYTFSADGLPQNHMMMLTAPFVMYGLLRYLYLIHVRGEGGEPEEILLHDRPLQATVALWSASVFVVLYLT